MARISSLNAQPVSEAQAPRAPAKPAERVSAEQALELAQAKASAPTRASHARGAPVPVASASILATSQGREQTPQQNAERAYRRALSALEEGRVNEAVAVFQQALAFDARHEAARETLVRLLLENRRQGEAISQLQQGLAADPKQPALAMLLARLQVEQGGPAIETLMRTLPFASGNSEYQAFLAAVLQRAQRHKEAAEYYALALRGAPQNGVWWMGLGISQQAEQRLPEAREAFAHAKASASLTPDLLVFVERKLQQLGR